MGFSVYFTNKNICFTLISALQEVISLFVWPISWCKLPCYFGGGFIHICRYSQLLQTASTSLRTYHELFTKWQLLDLCAIVHATNCLNFPVTLFAHEQPEQGNVVTLLSMWVLKNRDYEPCDQQSWNYRDIPGIILNYFFPRWQIMHKDKKRELVCK